MRYASIIVYGCAVLLLFAVGSALGFVAFSSLGWALTSSEAISNGVGIVAGILFGTLFAYPLFVEFRGALEARRRREM